MTRKLSTALVTIVSVLFYIVIMPFAIVAFMAMSVFYLIAEYFGIRKESR
jgi:hypothetical protein